mgnify:CR=1 FL=1
MAIRLADQATILAQTAGFRATEEAARPKRTALGHVDVVAGCAARPVGTRLRLNGDGLRRANSLAQLATVPTNRRPQMCQGVA